MGGTILDNQGINQCMLLEVDFSYEDPKIAYSSNNIYLFIY